MHFAKSLENTIIPEWKRVYLDYKGAKKKLKKLAKQKRARAASETPMLPSPALPVSPGTERPSTQRKMANYGSFSESPVKRPPGRSDRSQSATHLSLGSPTLSIREEETGGDDSEYPKGSTVSRPVESHFHSKFLDRIALTKPSGPQTPHTMPPGSPIEMLSKSDFFDWLDGQLEMINTFYKQKSYEAGERLRIIRMQLRTMQKDRTKNSGAPKSGTNSVTNWIFSAERDFVRSKVTTGDEESSYRLAKRRLRAAMIEYYHSLELLKSYRLMNKTGFQKILKKYMKLTETRSDYMVKVNESFFASSDIVDQLITQTEDMYARYFERGIRKNAVERLRTKEGSQDYGGAIFRSGLFLGIGVPLVIHAIVDGTVEGQSSLNASILLQIYGGFGLPLIFLLLFGLNARAWHMARINYVFIFELNSNDSLDYRQFIELPSLLIGILGIVMYFTFLDLNDILFPQVYYPILFLGIALLVFLNPFNFGYRSARSWLGESLGRLVFSGFFPVEFRDFFLGDQFCSLSYSMANLPFFFCLYSKHWTNNEQCNSSHSRVLGFFFTLPGIWRLLQCLRRYYDTRNVFPHLINGGKYLFTILVYMTLSLWRIDKGDSAKAGFIFCAIIYGLYTSSWDLFLDWSLLHPYARSPFLRNELGFRHAWVYYMAMVLDPILRNSWIFYVIYPQNIQQSAGLSFYVALAEVFRRAMWNFFRVENEHCTNVGKFRAFRDNIPLPYAIDHERSPLSPQWRGANLSRQATKDSVASMRRRRSGNDNIHEGEGRERAQSVTSPQVVSMRALAYATIAIQDRHAEDFTRRKPSHSNHEVQDGGSTDDVSTDEGNVDQADTGDADDVSEGASSSSVTPTIQALQK